jgi:UDP-glucose 4-epimerase
MRHHDVVIHLASNPDIAAAAANPPIDFWEGTYLTQNVVEAMRVTATKTILYASGSGIYGDLGNYEIPEDHGPLIPVSTYGASKLAGEALISSYCHMFGLTGRCFRFGNVVGPSQTHGVGYDFICRLTADPSQLRILGNGQQTKSYIHVDDIINAVLHSYSCETKRFQVYNVATGDYITVNRIAELAAEALNLDFTTIQLNYTGGDRGWLGDVPIVRLDTKRIQDLGWKCRRNCEEAISASVRAIATQVKNGLIPIPHS